MGVWDTVGAIGSNVRIARHAMAIDEHRRDFAPTIWELRGDMNMKQVWFCGSHSDIGGSYGHDRDGTVLSDIALKWMIDEAVTAGLTIEGHLKEGIKLNPLASIHDSRRSFYRIKRKLYRDLDHKKGDVIIHPSVKVRWEKDEKYRPANLKRYVDKFGWV